MGKNIGKACFWYGLYLAIQFVITFFIIIFDAISGKLSFNIETDDAEVITEIITEYVGSITLPILIITGFIVIGVYIVFRFTSGKNKDFRKTEANIFSFMGLSGFAYNMIVSLIITLIIGFFSLIVPNIHTLIEEANAQDPLMQHNFFVTLLGVGIVVPIMEEIVFRYGICGTIGESNRTLGIILSSVLFGLAHGNFIQTIYTGVFGLFLAVVYTKNKNLALPAIAHITFNSLTVIYEKFNIDWLVYIIGSISLIGMFVMFFCIPEIRYFYRLPKIQKKETVSKQQHNCQIYSQCYPPYQQSYQNFTPNNYSYTPHYSDQFNNRK